MGPSAVLCTLAFVTCDGELEKVFVQVSGTTKFVSQKEDTKNGGRSLKGGERARGPRGQAGWTLWGPQPTAHSPRLQEQVPGQKNTVQGGWRSWTFLVERTKVLTLGL